MEPVLREAVRIAIDCPTGLVISAEAEPLRKAVQQWRTSTHPTEGEQVRYFRSSIPNIIRCIDAQGACWRASPQRNWQIQPPPNDSEAFKQYGEITRDEAYRILRWEKPEDGPQQPQPVKWDDERDQPSSTPFQCRSEAEVKADGFEDAAVEAVKREDYAELNSPERWMWRAIADHLHNWARYFNQKADKQGGGNADSQG